MAKRIIISGGGTGGHIFPAIAIANALKRIAPDTEILFVGAQGKMEMEKVPAAGYAIIGLPIQGIDRKSLLKNLVLPFKLIASMRKAKAIIKEFRPDVAIGVGGYASGPLLLTARSLGIPYLIQEQNSFAGLTNKQLGRQAAKICVAFEGMERFFPANRLLITGNPIRPESVDIEGKDTEAYHYFGLDPSKKTVLVTGGSLGARTLNDCIEANLERLEAADVQVIWQCGSYYYNALRSRLGDEVKLHPFLQRMDLAYAAADLIVARAGAGTIAELYVVGKPVILVPSPNVAEDHQTKNAQALVDKQAAVLVKDNEASSKLVPSILDLLADKDACTKLACQIKGLAKKDADLEIAQAVLALN